MATEKKRKLDIGRLLEAADRRQRDFYIKLTDDERKEFSALVAMRFLSNVRDPALVDQYILLTNHYVNVDHWALRNHPELQWLLMSCVGAGRRCRHEWLAMPKRPHESKIESFVRRWYPNVNDLEMRILLDQFTNESFAEFVRASGTEEVEGDKLVAEFEKRR